MIGEISYNYTGNWTVSIVGGSSGQGSTKTVNIQITTTRLAEVTGKAATLSVISGQPFETSCQASFGVPKPAG